MEKKSPDAFRTISEVAEWLDVPTHVLRFWESRFTQVKPVKRAGGRRYYRPADMALLGGIKKLLHDDGLTIRGVQKVLREQGVKHVSGLVAAPGSESYTTTAGPAADAPTTALPPAPAELPAAEPLSEPDEADASLMRFPDIDEPDQPEEAEAASPVPEPDTLAAPAPEPFQADAPDTDPGDDDPGFAAASLPLSLARRTRTAHQTDALAAIYKRALDLRDRMARHDTAE